MKHLPGLIALSLAALPTAAWAQPTPATGTVSVDGQVAPICLLGAPTPVPVNLGQMVSTAGPRVGRIAVLPNQTVNLPNSFCNFAGSTVTVQATALTASDASSPQPGFARAVNYTASATGWAAGSTMATSTALRDGTMPTATGAGANQPLPKKSDIAVTLSNFTVPSDSLLVAGNYSGLVIVTLGPTVTAP